MTNTVTAVDLFCGAGGSSSGLLRACEALGLKLKLLAINHWQTAIDTHSANHPELGDGQFLVEARHIKAAIENVNPLDVVPSGHLDVLVASPECTHHARARGGKPMNDQKRASAMLILRWLDVLQVDNLLVENVVEFEEWCRLGTNGRPVKSEKGKLYDHFLDGIRLRGFHVETRRINAADYGDPTTRTRLFIIGRRGRRTIRWPEPTHSRTGGRSLLRKTKRWRAAREIIDWSKPGQSIFARKKALAPNTMRRILAGLEKFGGPELQPFLVILRNHMAGRSIDEPVPALAAQGQHVGVCEPFVLQVNHGENRKGSKRGNGGRVRSVDAPLPTVTASSRGLALCEPVVLQQQSGGAPRSVDQPLPTIATDGAQSLVRPFLVPFFGERTGQDPRVHDVDDPLPAVTSHGAGGLVEAEAFIVGAGGPSRSGRPRSVQDPLDTVMCRTHKALVQPFIFANRSHNAPKSVDGPIPPLCTGNHIALVQPEAFIVPPRNHQKPGPVDSVDRPLRTVTAVAGHTFGLVRPFLTKFNGTAKDRAYSVEQPLDTITGKHRFGLVVATVDGQQFLLDIRFRMLTPRELARAMSFEDSYVFAGNQGDQVKQIGNAVGCETAKALCIELIRDYAAKRPRRLEATA